MNEIVVCTHPSFTADVCDTCGQTKHTIRYGDSDAPSPCPAAEDEEILMCRKERCSTCHFYEEDPDISPREYGFCHKRAPVVTAEGNTRFAYMRYSGWCGDFEEPKPVQWEK